MSARPITTQRGDVRGAFVFALLATFALLSLVVVVVGARSYRMINATAEQAFVSRTGMSYLLGKLRGADEAGQIEVRQEQDITVLTLGQTFGGEAYHTYIYCDGVAVREYFARADLPFSPDYGEKIFDAASLTFALEGSLLEIEIVDHGGRTHESAFYLQAAKEGGA